MYSVNIEYYKAISKISYIIYPSVESSYIINIYRREYSYISSGRHIFHKTTKSWNSWQSITVMYIATLCVYRHHILATATDSYYWKFAIWKYSLRNRHMNSYIIYPSSKVIHIDCCWCCHIRRLQGSGCRAGAHRPSIGIRHRKLKELLMFCWDILTKKSTDGYLWCHRFVFFIIITPRHLYNLLLLAISRSKTLMRRMCENWSATK